MTIQATASRKCRRLLAIVGILGIGASALPSAAGAATTAKRLSQETLTVSYTQGNSIYSDTFFTDQRGYFEKNGLRITLRPINTSTADVVVALQSGNAPVNA